MAVKTSWSAGDVLTAADLTDTFAAKADKVLAGTQKTANYTLVAGDIGGRVQFSSATPVTLAIPPDSSMSALHGSQVRVINLGGGALTISPGAGVSLFPGIPQLLYQGAAAVLTKIADNGWNVAISPATAYIAPFGIVGGQVAGGVISAPTDYAVTFPAGRFTTAPQVTFGWYDDQGGHARAKNTTASGFTLTAWPISGSTITRVNWIAVQN